jgi:hypothetical protein
MHAHEPGLPRWRPKRHDYSRFSTGLQDSRGVGERKRGLSLRKSHRLATTEAAEFAALASSYPRFADARQKDLY